MKIVLALLLFVFITSVSFGQSIYQDVIYLKNGGIIRGIIIEQVPNKTIKIETVDRNVFVYQIDEIEKIAKEPYQSKDGFQPYYKIMLVLGSEISFDNYQLDRFKLNITGSYQINPHYSIGLGTGVRYYPELKTNIIPIYAVFQSNLLIDKTSPFIELGVGYSFIDDDLEALGLMASFLAGVSFKISDSYSISIGLGYEAQKMDVYLYYLDAIYKNRINADAVSINVGLSL